MSFDLRAQLQKTLGDAYRLERELGGGGMSRVFVADELRLDRKVVVKVLSPELAQGISVERFEREIRTVAGLQQANIVPVLTAGDTDGLPFYTMPFVDGESLRARLGGGPLAVTGVIGVLRDVSKALAYAHQRGVVHRDIKPDNVMLSERHALVADFGVAKAISDATGAEGITTQGVAVGTAAYMSPEQLQGRPQPASDQYALGIVVYEWLAGDLPFRGTFTEVASQHVLAPPPPLRQKIPDISYEVEAVIQTALAKDPQQRFASVTAFTNALEQASRAQLQPGFNTVEENLPTLRATPHPPTPQPIPVHFTPIPPPPPLSPLATESNYRVMLPPSNQPGMYQQTQEPVKPKQGISRRALFAGLSGVAIGSAITGVLLYEHFQSSGPQAVATPTPGASSTAQSATTTPAPGNTPTTGSTAPATAQGDTLAVYTGHSDQVTTVEWSPNNALLLASGSEDKTARVWSYTNLNNDVRHQQANMVYSLTWSPSGQSIASGGENPTVEIWDTTNGNTVLSYGGHSQPVYTVKWSHDGSRIVSGSGDTSAQVWNASNATLIVSYTQHVKAVWAVAWSPDGARIASASLDGTVQIWNSSTAANLATFHDPQNASIRAVAWSPNGQYIAFGGDSKVVQVWDVNTNNMAVSYTGHNGHIEDVKWSPDGTLIASAGQDQTVQIWDATTGSHLFSYTGHTNLIWAIDWSLSGQHIASASQDGTVRVWQAV